MTDTGIRVLVISSTVYNEIPSEPTVIVVPVFDTVPDTGFGVDLGDDDWAAPGLVTSLRKARTRNGSCPRSAASRRTFGPVGTCCGRPTTDR